MIKKSLRKAAVGTIAAGALALPAAGAIAPQMQLVACQYPDSIASSTDVIIDTPLVRPGAGVRVDVEVFASGRNPNGRVVLSVTGPSGKRVRTKEKAVRDGNISFVVGNFRLGKKRDQKTFKVTALYNGSCRFKNSSGTGYFVVSR